MKKSVAIIITFFILLSIVLIGCEISDESLFEFIEDLYKTEEKTKDKSWQMVGYEIRDATDGVSSLFVYGGKAYIAFKDWTAGNKVTVFEEVNDSWVDVGGRGVFNPSVGTPSNGSTLSLFVINEAVHVGYKDTGGNSYILTYNGSVWSQSGSIGSMVYSVSLFVDGSTQYMAYEDNWSIEVYNANPSYVDSGTEPSLYVYNGIPYVAYLLTDGKNIYIRKNEDVTWDPIIGQINHTDRLLGYISLQVLNDNPIIAYRDNGEKAAYVRIYNQGNMDVVSDARTNKFPNAYLKYDEAVSVYDDAIYLAYIDGDKSNLPMVQKYESGAWGSLGLENSSIGPGFNVSIHVDNGTPYVSYHRWDGALVVMKYE